MEHLSVIDMHQEMKHKGYIWHETKERFNKLMQEKIMELGYNPKMTDKGTKYYQKEASYLQKSKEEIDKAKALYMQNTE